MNHKSLVKALTLYGAHLKISILKFFFQNFRNLHQILSTLKKKISIYLISLSFSDFIPPEGFCAFNTPLFYPSRRIKRDKGTFLMKNSPLVGKNNVRTNPFGASKLINQQDFLKNRFGQKIVKIFILKIAHTPSTGRKIQTILF
jgi:hypothetical protein